MPDHRHDHFGFGIWLAGILAVFALVIAWSASCQLTDLRNEAREEQRIECFEQYNSEVLVDCIEAIS